VEMGGIEPPSDGRPRGLLRAHPAIDFLACDVMQACCQRSSVDEMSERTHRHGPHPVAPWTTPDTRLEAPPGLTD